MTIIRPESTPYFCNECNAFTSGIILSRKKKERICPVCLDKLWHCPECSYNGTSADGKCPKCNYLFQEKDGNNLVI